MRVTLLVFVGLFSVSLVSYILVELSRTIGTRQPPAEEVQWTRNAFFSLEKGSHGPFTIPEDYAA